MVTIAEIKETIMIPDGVSVNLEHATVTITGEKGTNTRTFAHPKIKVTQKDNTLVVTSKNARRYLLSHHQYIQIHRCILFL